MHRHPDPASASWPEPDPIALDFSRRLRAQICAGAASGPITFDRFMAEALYAPGLGYYSGGSRKFGAAGDFITAPEISPLFGHCVARQCAQVLDALGGGDVVEFGAGTGRLAVDVLTILEQLGQLPTRYRIIELSADLANRQRDLILARLPHLASRVEWLTALPERVRGVVVANEVLDAMPVRRFRLGEQGVNELHVTCAEDEFKTVVLPAEAALAEHVEKLRATYNLAPGYESEIGIAAEEWTRTLGHVLEQGVALLIDYGFPQREFFHPQRATGTLMCHYRHRAHADPFYMVGLQDITAHVDFTAIAEAALEGGLDVMGFTTQAHFLMSTGLLEELAAPVDARTQILRAGEVKKLTLPSEMGELFKVLALGRGVTTPLKGFALRDDRNRL